MGGIIPVILRPHQLPSPDVPILMRGRLPTISLCRFLVVRPGCDEHSTPITFHSLRWAFRSRLLSGGRGPISIILMTLTKILAGISTGHYPENITNSYTIYMKDFPPFLSLVRSCSFDRLISRHSRTVFFALDPRYSIITDSITTYCFVYYAPSRGR